MPAELMPGARMGRVGSRIFDKVSPHRLQLCDGCLDEIISIVQIYLKLENLQPVGSFKIRGACNALRSKSESDLAKGVFTCSAGNFAQGLAWSARQKGISCDIIVPNTAPRTKEDIIYRFTVLF